MQTVWTEEQEREIVNEAVAGFGPEIAKAGISNDNMMAAIDLTKDIRVYRALRAGIWKGLFKVTGEGEDATYEVAEPIKSFIRATIK
jgi:hypothetical protein